MWSQASPPLRRTSPPPIGQRRPSVPSAGPFPSTPPPRGGRGRQVDLSQNGSGLLLQGMGSRLDPPAFRPPKFHGVFRGCESLHVFRRFLYFSPGSHVQCYFGTPMFSCRWECSGSGLSLSLFLSPGLRVRVAPHPRASSAPDCCGAFGESKAMQQPGNLASIISQSPRMH